MKSTTPVLSKEIQLLRVVTAMCRSIGRFLLIVSLLVSSAPASPSADCGAHCARKKKTCDCTKKSPARDSSISARSCPPGCCHPALAPGLSPEAPVAVNTNFAPPFETACLRYATSMAAKPFRGFALFQRPPPHHLLLAQ